MLELENLLLLYGDMFYRHDPSVFQEEFKILFDQYKKDIRKRPNNRIRYYSTRDTLQDLQLSANFENEASAHIVFPFVPSVPSSQIGDEVKNGLSKEFPRWKININLDKNNKLKTYHYISDDTTFRIAALPEFRISYTASESIPETFFQQQWDGKKYLASLHHKHKYSNPESIIANVPMGAYSIRADGFFKKNMAITTDPVYLQDVLKNCYENSKNASHRLVLLICCRGYGQGIPPIVYQTRQKRGLINMMTDLALTDDTKKRKRQQTQTERQPKKRV
jgi:hypothetical protein